MQDSDVNTNKELKEIKIIPNNEKAIYTFRLDGATGGTFKINIGDKATSDINFDAEDITTEFWRLEQYASELESAHCYD